MEVSVSHRLPKLRLVLGQFGRETGVPSRVVD